MGSIGKDGHPSFPSIITAGDVRAAGIRPSDRSVAAAVAAGGGFLVLLPLDSGLFAEGFGPRGTVVSLTVAQVLPTRAAALDLAAVAGAGNGIFGIAEVDADGGVVVEVGVVGG